MIQNYYLGCPIWANKDWVGHFFSENAKPKDFLSEYASVFNTVEGNNTFYGLPKRSTVEKWAAQSAANFRFSFKFPKVISHEQRLRFTQNDVKAFFKILEPLGEKLGICFLQLPPAFSPPELTILDEFLNNLPANFQYAVEVRHTDFFVNQEKRDALDSILKRHNANRAMFITETLHAIPNGNSDVIIAQGKKPKMPSYFKSTANIPFLRYVGYQTVEDNEPHLPAIVQQVANWIIAGKTPYVFFHSPNDFYAPQLCKRFHELLKSELGENADIGKCPTFPIDKPQNKVNEQLDLFGI